MDIVEKQNPSRTRVGTAVRERGVERAAEIIRAAQSILVREGLAKLTTRRVARELGISVGNLAYYFSSKESLLQAIIEDVIRGYDDELAQESKRFPDSPPKRFKAFLQYMIGDAQKADVQGFFYQFWGLSSHNELAAALRLEMYSHFSEQTAELLADVHPDMPDSKLKLMALSVITSLEGLHVVYGSSEPFLQQYEGFDEFIYEQILLNVGIPPGP